MLLNFNDNRLMEYLLYKLLKNITLLKVNQNHEYESNLERRNWFWTREYSY